MVIKSLSQFARLKDCRTDKSGAYLIDGNVANDVVAPHASDPVEQYVRFHRCKLTFCQLIAGKLWTVTEEIVGQRFTY